MDSLGETFKRWTCPSDRELTLRAKIRAGWSSRTSHGDMNDDGQFSINESEQAAILQVLERANLLQEQENERNRILSERLERLRRQAKKCDQSGLQQDDGQSLQQQQSASASWLKNCILCNEEPSFFRKFYTCNDCNNPVCKKCSVDQLELEARRAFWLCKICFESRELLKRTNKWIELPDKQHQQQS